MNAPTTFPLILDAVAFHQMQLHEALTSEDRSRLARALDDLVTNTILQLNELIKSCLPSSTYEDSKSASSPSSSDPCVEWNHNPTPTEDKEGFSAVTRTLEDGDLYLGCWLGGLQHGMGCLQHSSTGNIYIGDHLMGRKHGYGMFLTPTRVHTGQWRCGVKAGHGVQTVAGSSYEGSFAEGYMSGKGVFRYPSGDEYNGEFRSDECWGNGVLTLSNGVKCEGEWGCLGLNGKGCIKYLSGDIYEGEWKSHPLHWTGMHDPKEVEMICISGWASTLPVRPIRHGEGKMSVVGDENDPKPQIQWMFDQPIEVMPLLTPIESTRSVDIDDLPSELSRISSGLSDNQGTFTHRRRMAKLHKRSFPTLRRVHSNPVMASEEQNNTSQNSSTILRSVSDGAVTRPPEETDHSDNDLDNKRKYVRRPWGLAGIVVAAVYNSNNNENSSALTSINVQSDDTNVVQPTSEDHPNNVSVCAICLESPTDDDFCLKCGHYFCVECLSIYVTNCICDGITSIRCPHIDSSKDEYTQCNVILTSDEVESLVSDPVIHSKYLLFSAMEFDKNVRQCPQCPHFQSGNPDHPSMVCGGCGHTYCFTHSDAHPASMSCEQYEKNQKANPELTATATLMKNICKPCPNCNVPIHKESGCNYVVCSRCNTALCWACGGQYCIGHTQYCNGNPNSMAISGKQSCMMIGSLVVLIPLALIIACFEQWSFYSVGEVNYQGWSIPFIFAFSGAFVFPMSLFCKLLHRWCKMPLVAIVFLVLVPTIPIFTGIGTAYLADDFCNDKNIDCGIRNPFSLIINYNELPYPVSYVIAETSLVFTSISIVPLLLVTLLIANFRKWHWIFKLPMRIIVTILWIFFQACGVCFATWMFVVIGNSDHMGWSFLMVLIFAVAGPIYSFLVNFLLDSGFVLPLERTWMIGISLWLFVIVMGLPITYIYDDNCDDKHVYCRNNTPLILFYGAYDLPFPVKRVMIVSATLITLGGIIGIIPALFIRRFWGEGAL